MAAKRHRLAGWALVSGLAVLLAGCGGVASSTTLSLSSSPVPPSAAEVRTYVAQVERVRLPVNQLLQGADPILDGFRTQAITPQAAGDQMSALENRFAAYVVAAESVNPQNATLRKLNAPYANTYYLEDNYLSVLAADLPNRSFDGLPDTQNAQRLAIIEWRTQLQAVADAAGVRLPADLQQAGRGEIAPSPTDS
ncbi:MAG: hypothetical protein ACRDWB_04150 [Acidimicrobiales bacterium]